MSLTAPGVLVRRAQSRLMTLGWRAIRLASMLLGLDETSLPKDNPLPAQNRSWIAELSLAAATGLMLIALAQIAGMHYLPDIAYKMYWVGIILILFPISFCLALPDASRNERLLLVIMMGLAFYAIKILHSPVRFTGYDEFLHWVTALNMMEQHRLFGPNSLLEVGPHYPGLEILTNAFSGVSGLSIFTSGLIIIGLGKAALLGALFLIAETITRSSRVAGIACVVIMASSTFNSFETQYAYASLALVLTMLALLAAVRVSQGGPHILSYTVAAALLAVAVTVTHHLTSYFLAAMLAALAALELARGQRQEGRLHLVWLAGIAVAADVLWSRFAGSTGAYLTPVLLEGVKDFWALITSSGVTRTPLEDADGVRKPLWENVTSMGSTMLVCLGLAAGFLRSLNLAGGRIIFKSKLRFRVEWRTSALVLLTLLTLGFPLSILLRLTPFGWELGYRMISYVFFGICIVVAVAIAGLWQKPRPIVIASILTVMVLGGFATGSGPNFINYPYKVAADSQSIELLGVQAAEWTRTWLGRGNIFAADRINQLLLAVYGRQEPLTGLKDEAKITELVFARALGDEERKALSRGWVDYVMIDLRLTTALPRYGVYFEAGEDEAVHARPPDPPALLKFNDIKGVDRPFDNGAIIIYDLRSLHAAKL